MMPQVVMMTASLPIELTIGASSRKEGLPTVKVGDSLTLGLSRLSNASSRWHNEGAISITDPFGLQVVKIPFRLGRYTRGQFRVPLHKNLLSGIYTVTVGFVDSAFKDLSTKEAPSKVIGESPRVFGCFRLEGGHPSVVTHTITYEATVRNKSDGPVTNLEVFIAVPPPLPPRQDLLSLRLTPVTGREANDLTGNNWVHFVFDKLGPRERVRCGYTAVVRSRSVRYALPLTTKSVPVPDQLAAYTKPEWFIESHHEYVKQMARGLAASNPLPVPYVAAAMRAVASTVKYVPQAEERGAAYAVEKRVGDCTEFAALLAALCRANGIPARLSAGFAFGGHRWERHAWTEVWLRGIWIPADPTWHGAAGLLGITSRHIACIIGNWMSNRVRQEFSLRWYAQPGTQPPQLSTKWQVRQMTRTSPQPAAALSPAPFTLEARAPDAVPRGSRLPVNAALLRTGPETPAAEQMVLTATLSDGEIDHVVAIEPFTPQPAKPVNLAFHVPMPEGLRRVVLWLQLWIDRKPTSTLWRKTIGLI
jgi:transglutaminase-like putative cysteine protease